MRRIKFRLTYAEHERAEIIARSLGTTVPALLKDLGLKGIINVSVEIALNLYKGGKAVLKRAWMLSGLEFHEFLALLQERNIDPVISDSLVDKMIENVESLTFDEMFPRKSKAEMQKLIQSHEG
jgi:predicted HTH domain antitoxin